jgi:hypothetical protein
MSKFMSNIYHFSTKSFLDQIGQNKKKDFLSWRKKIPFGKSNLKNI